MRRWRCQAPPRFADSHAEHNELVIGESRSLPLRAAQAAAGADPRPNVEASYFDAVRQWADRLLDEGRAGCLQPRSAGVVGRQDDIVVVQILAGRGCPAATPSARIIEKPGGNELSRFWAAEPAQSRTSTHTVPRSTPSPTPPRSCSPTIAGGTVHATPAAAVLSGRPLARLLTMRVEDVGRVAEREAVAGA